MASDDAAYFRQRAVAEREAARLASRAEIAEIHQEMARLYEKLIEHGARRPELSVAWNDTETNSGNQGSR